MRITSPLTRWNGAAIALAVVLFAPTMTPAQIDRSAPPAPGPAPAVHIGEHQSFLLPNGMRVIVVENHKVPLVSVQLKFDIEPFMQGDKAGLTDLAGELLASGTARYTKEQIDEKVDQLGATFSTASDGLYASGLTRNFNTLMELVYAVTTTARFPPVEFEKAKKRMLSALESRKDDPDAIAEQVARHLTFIGAHPYGEVVTEATVGRVTREAVFTYYQRFFRPTEGYIVFVGDITLKDARGLAEKYFGTWEAATVTSTTDAQGNEVVQGLGPIRKIQGQPPLSPTRHVAFVDKPGAPQSVLRVVFPVHLHPWDPRAITAQVMNTILGGGVFNARLMQNLREARGYTYGASSSLDADRYSGSFSAGASVRTAVTDSAVMEIMFELENIRNTDVKPEELSLAKNYLAGSFARSLEDPRTIARFALNTYLNKLPEDYYTTYLQRLDTVGTASVRAAANEFLFPDNAVILVVGDKEQLANKLVALSFDRAVSLLDMNGEPWKEDAEPAPAGVTAETVLADYFKAVGGRGAVAGIKDLKIEMSGSMMGMPVTMTQWFAYPDKSASEIKSGTMVLEKLVFDGVRGQRTNMNEGRKELEDQDLVDAAQNAYPFPEMHYAEFRHQMKLAGIVEVEGKRAYKITTRTENGGLFHEYYDTATGFKLRRVEPKAMSEGNMNVTTDYADYRPEAGIQFPHLVTQNMGVQVQFTVTAIQVNKGIAENVFTLE